MSYYHQHSEKYDLDDKNENDMIISERENIVMIDTRDCVGQNSLIQSQLTFLYDKIAEGGFNITEFQNVLTNNIVDNKKLLNKGTEFSGFPEINSLKPIIKDNCIELNLKKHMKRITSLEITNIVIPRDIISLTVYLPNFIEESIEKNENNNNLVKDNKNILYSTESSPIPPTLQDYKNNIEGFYGSSVRFWRTYTGNLSMQNPETPPPYNLWSPTQGSWPFQPQPKKNQRCPTYYSKNGVIFSGYGLYDLEDFPYLQEITLQSGIKVQIPIRKLILKMIAPVGQFINGVSAENIIDNSNDTDDLSDPLTQTGYGDYQRFIPGPGLGMNYQPNQTRTNKPSPIDITISTYNSGSGVLGSMPIPFPIFIGNYWGPYENPGDRFQNNGLRDTIDELYLNGDLKNMEGNPVIHKNYDPTLEVYTYSMYYDTTINKNVTFKNFEFSSNPNIKNAIRLNYEGSTFTDLGPEKGELIHELENYRSIFVSSAPNTDLVIRIRNATRNVYTQSTNNSINESNFNIPVRLNLGTGTGTQEYIESLDEMISGKDKGFWEHNFYPPLASMKDLKIEFYTYNGKPIHLEKNLGFNDSINDTAILLSEQGSNSNISMKMSYNTEDSLSTGNFVPSSAIISSYNNISFDPDLINYTNRNISMIIKFKTYHSEGKGITEKFSNNKFSYENVRETTLEDSNGNKISMLPLASNIDEYGV
jgi:hypothetical protein